MSELNERITAPSQFVAPVVDIQQHPSPFQQPAPIVNLLRHAHANQECGTSPAGSSTSASTLSGQDTSGISYDAVLVERDIHYQQTAPSIVSALPPAPLNVPMSVPQPSFSVVQHCGSTPVPSTSRAFIHNGLSESDHYKNKFVALRRYIRALVVKNTALSDEVTRLNYRILQVQEERRLLLKRLLMLEKRERVSKERNEAMKAQKKQKKLILKLSGHTVCTPVATMGTGKPRGRPPKHPRVTPVRIRSTTHHHSQQQEIVSMAHLPIQLDLKPVIRNDDCVVDFNELAGDVEEDIKID